MTCVEKSFDSFYLCSKWSWTLTRAVYLLRRALQKCFKSLKASFHKQLCSFNLRCITGWSSRHRHIVRPSEKKGDFYIEFLSREPNARAVNSNTSSFTLVLPEKLD